MQGDDVERPLLLGRGTDRSNPSPSCAESCANLTFGLSAYMTGSFKLAEPYFNAVIAAGPMPCQTDIG